MAVRATVRGTGGPVNPESRLCDQPHGGVMNARRSCREHLIERAEESVASSSRVRAKGLVNRRRVGLDSLRR